MRGRAPSIERVALNVVAGKDMLRITYRAVLFPPFGNYKAVTSEGREFEIKAPAFGFLTNHRIRFLEQNKELFTARYVDGGWILSDDEAAPDFSLKRVGGLAPKWALSYNGESFSEDEICERMGIKFANAPFPDSHIITCPNDEEIFPALVYGALRGRLPD